MKPRGGASRGVVFHRAHVSPFCCWPTRNCRALQELSNKVLFVKISQAVQKLWLPKVCMCSFFGEPPLPQHLPSTLYPAVDHKVPAVLSQGQTPGSVTGVIVDQQICTFIIIFNFRKKLFIQCNIHNNNIQLMFRTREEYVYDIIAVKLWYKLIHVVF